ncbi:MULTISPECIES: hypothetical protein [unclassified Microcoleus]
MLSPSAFVDRENPPGLAADGARAGIKIRFYYPKIEAAAGN